jgi:hypothetical protein
MTDVFKLQETCIKSLADLEAANLRIEELEGIIDGIIENDVFMDVARNMKTALTEVYTWFYTWLSSDEPTALENPSWECWEKILKDAEQQGI